MDGYSYDAAGNMLNDGVHTYTYDAENRIIIVDGGNTATYSYDGEGNRAVKTNSSSINSGGDTPDPAGTVEFLYDLRGRVVHTEAPNSSTGWRGEVYAGNRHLVTYIGQEVINHSDWLGTERFRDYVTFDTHQLYTQNLTSLPFGDWLAPGITGNWNTINFTGQQHDFESGLDDFGARYDSSSLGRFMSPDPLMASAKVWDAQSWNRYSYARNNPLLFIDPTGMKEVTANQCAKDKHCVTINVNVIYDKNSNNGKGLTDAQKSAFEKGQLQNAKDEYGNADIHLDVTYTAGSLTIHDEKGTVLGVKEGALNVVVSDQVLGAESPMMAGKTALSFIPANSADKDDLSHEMAHQFMGDTQNPIGRIASKSDYTHEIYNALTDTNNAYERAWMRTFDSHFSWYPAASLFNGTAGAFQKSIQPATIPQ
jgi:RHS repeat-associated protein